MAISWRRTHRAAWLGAVLLGGCTGSIGDLTGSAGLDEPGSSGQAGSAVSGGHGGQGSHAGGAAGQGTGGKGGPVAGAGSQGGANAGGKGGANAGSQAGTNAGSQGGTNAGSQGGANAGSQAGTNAGSQGGGGQGSQPTTRTLTLPLRRLTPFELDNSLRELINDQSGAALELRPGKPKAANETDPNENQLGLDTAQTLENLVYTAAKAFAQDPDQLLGCSPQSPGDGCVQGFVGTFGRRAFRRPLTPDQVARFTQVEATLEPKYGRAEAVARTVQALLLSPNFLYLTSFGVDGGAYEDAGPDVLLESYELASRLAFFLWASPPDEELLTAAGQGQLATSEQIGAQVDRMLAAPNDQKAANAAARFVAGWLGILDVARADKKDPAWNGALAGSMLRETDLLVKDWFTKGEAGIAGLIDADYSFIDESLAQLYGINDAVSGGTPARVQISDLAQRRGVMAHASFLAAHSTDTSSSPVHRGKWVLEAALCSPVGPPPPNANSSAPQQTPDMTTREWNQAIADKPTCGGCHNRMAPPGFVFEDFDILGRRRDSEKGKPIVTATTLETGVDEVDGPVADHRDLAHKLAASEQLPACVAEHWLTYALALDTSSDEATRQQVTGGVKTSARGAMAAIARSAAFRLARRTISLP
jgi:hypothetical protein